MMPPGQSIVESSPVMTTCVWAGTFEPGCGTLVAVLPAQTNTPRGRAKAKFKGRPGDSSTVFVDRRRLA
jgi:hypothetical protein